MKDTKIAWCDHTFNQWVGCERKSEGCDNCYARTMHERWNGKGSFLTRKPTSDANWLQPLRWSVKAQQEGKRAKVFVGSMCDWLDLRAADEVRTELLGMILDERLHIEWLMLTKRPECWSTALIRAMKCAKEKGLPELAQKIKMWVEGLVPEHVWFGVTAENQERWDERVRVLRGIPAAVKWVSCEPLIGKVICKKEEVRSLDWIVAGGENGPGARPCRKEWITDLCIWTKSEQRMFFFKQWGSNSVDGGEFLPNVCDKTREWPERGARVR
jgi:protein gp37